MTPTRPSQSTTVPRNFFFGYIDEPKTPEQEQFTIEQPYPPKVRIRRRRNRVSSSQIDEPLIASNEIPVPTIEVPQPPPDFATFLPDVNPVPQEGFLAPTSSIQTFLSAPKTPISQLSNPFDATPADTNNWTANSFSSQKTSISRPSSAWSNMSDSSTSSFDSSDSLPSFGESCTSPESDNTDPFVFPAAKNTFQNLASPVQITPLPRLRQRFRVKVQWTEEMDDHLWNTYMAYLQDPTVTPFKMLPGVAPPLGVCHRVAREAKKTWKGPKAPLSPITPVRPTSIAETLQNSTPLSSFNSFLSPQIAKFPDSPDTVRPYQYFPRSLSEDPPQKLRIRWPGSSSATRKRFRELCKRKPSLAPHYQRLMQTRSPSPFESSHPPSRSHSSRWTSPFGQPESSSSFSTRDMNFSLATSTATSMQPDGPLARLTSESQTPRQQIFTPTSNRSSNRTGAHQKSQSLQLHLGIPTSQQSNYLGRLASPFQELPPRQVWQNLFNSEAIRRQEGNDPSSSNAPVLDSPLEIHAPRPMSGSMKRRAQYQLGDELLSDDPDTRSNLLENLFNAPNANGKRRVRSRGFSLGAVNQSREHRPLADLFTPPSGNDEEMENSIPSLPPIPSDAHLFPPLAPSLTHSRRLGSPFAPSAAAGSTLTNTFPRSLLPPAFLEDLAAPSLSRDTAQKLPNQPSKASHLYAYKDGNSDGPSSSF